MARAGGLPLPTITDDRVLGEAVIQKSLRFRSGASTYLNRTPSSAGNRKTWTWSAWIKRGTLGTQQRFFTADDNATSATYLILEFQSDDNLRALAGTEAASGTLTKETAAVIRDTNSWYHLVFKFDAANTSAVWYINGEEITDLNASTNPSNQDYQVNATTQHFLGRAGSSVSSGGAYFDGYMAEVNFVDGQALDASYFGYTEFQTGIWRPKRYEGTYGTNGFYLDFSDNSSTTTLGIDKSPNGNDFTANNFSVSAGIDNDSFTTHTPTSENEFATLNSNLQISSGAQYRNGNYTFYMTHDGNHMRASSNMPVNSGKWYAEFKLTTYSFQSGSYPYIGVCADDLWVNSWGGEAGTAYQTGGTIWRNGSSISSGHSTYTQGDTISIAIDLDQGTPKIWWAKNGTYINSGNPATNANGTDIDPTSNTGYYNFAMSLWASTGQWDANFGQRPFSYDIPSGFKTLCTDNIRSTQNIRPQKHFDTLLWSGDGTDGRVITGLEFKPDFVWIKCRNSDPSHQLYDTIRGANNYVSTDGSSGSPAVDSTFGYMGAFGSNGFTLTAGTHSTFPMGSINHSGRTYVAWCWKAGGAAASNSDGSVTSSVSANQESGFSVVKWTTQSGAYTVGHGLGKAPKLIITNHLSNTGTGWPTFTTVIDGTMDYGYISANSTFTDAVQYGIDVPNSTTFQMHSNFLASSGDCIAWCWSEIPGYSKFGRWTGTGGADAAFLETGFRPAWIIYKATNGAHDWHIFDAKRDIDNPVQNRIRSNSNVAEDSNTYFDILSNGFKVRNGLSGSNGGGEIHFYMAFADQTALTAFDQANPNAR